MRVQPMYGGMHMYPAYDAQDVPPGPPRHDIYRTAVVWCMCARAMLHEATPHVGLYMCVCVRCGKTLYVLCILYVCMLVCVSSCNLCNLRM